MSRSRGFGTTLLVTWCCLLSQTTAAEFGELIWTLTPIGFDRTEAFSGADFGGQVALEGDLAVVGSDNDPYNGEDAGAVWVFDLSTGSPLHVLDPPGVAAGDGLAEAIAIDGETVVFSSDSKNLDRGEAYVFNGRTGEFLGAIGAAAGNPGDEFGQDVAVSGNLILVSAEDVDAGQGAGFLFDASTRQQLHKLSANDLSETEVGDTAAISGNHALLGSAGGAAVYLFDATNGALRQKLTVSGGGGFGSSLDASDNLAVVGAPELDEERGAAFLISLDSAAIVNTLRANGGQAGDVFGDAVAIDGAVVLVTAAEVNEQAGAVYVFDAVTGMQVARLESPNAVAGEEFGKSIAVSNGRALIGAEEGVVGGEGSGIAYVFNVSFGDLADVDDNGVVEGADIDMISATIRAAANLPAVDVNHDGVVDVNDRELWVAALNHTYFGDSTLNGVFDTGDLVQVFQIGEYEDNVVGNSGWADGDWDGDGDFATGDLVKAFQAGGFEAGPRAAVANVPEPSTTLLAIVGAMIGLVRSGTRRFRS